MEFYYWIAIVGILVTVVGALFGAIMQIKKPLIRLETTVNHTQESVDNLRTDFASFKSDVSKQFEKTERYIRADAEKFEAKYLELNNKIVTQGVQLEVLWEREQDKNR
jgi:hypothetical protein